MTVRARSHFNSATVRSGETLIAAIATGNLNARREDRRSEIKSGVVESNYEIGE